MLVELSDCLVFSSVAKVCLHESLKVDEDKAVISNVVICDYYFEI